MSLAVVIQIVVPLLLIGIIAINRQPNRLRWLVTSAAFGMTILYLLISARWDISSLYLRAAIPVLFIAASIVGYRRIRPTEEVAKLQTAVFWAANVGLIVLMSGFLWFSLRGYLTPDGTVDLASPLKGTHVVLNGGVSPFTNAHYRISPQDYALDILGVNSLGARASAFGNRRNLETYVIYGASIRSPCDGEISAVVNDLVDHSPPDGDTKNPAGNHVLIECGDIEVLLAHMKQHSVRVVVGDVVTVGDPIGEVGNSGNTTEPHLHIHAERSGEPGVILDGHAVPITIDGRFLVRNSIFSGSESR